jgi:hypothetical protein
MLLPADPDREGHSASRSASRKNAPPAPPFATRAGNPLPTRTGQKPVRAPRHPARQSRLRRVLPDRVAPPPTALFVPLSVRPSAGSASPGSPLRVAVRAMRPRASRCRVAGARHCGAADVVRSRKRDAQAQESGCGTGPCGSNTAPAMRFQCARRVATPHL